MTKHLKYLWYVLRHKWFVLQEGLKLHTPLYLLIIHDWQKFTPTEWNPYVLTFYGGWKYGARPRWLVSAFDSAWLHHIHLGPHHWQYWVLQNDDGSTKAIEMPDKYRREMLADWRGAGRAIFGDDNTREWYLENKNRMVFHPKTREWIEHQLGGLRPSV